MGEIDYVIRCCDNAFNESVSNREVYVNLIDKIYQKGRFLYAHNDEILGYCAFYANDREGKKAYISLLAVAPRYQKIHIGTKLLNETLMEMRKYGMEQCQLEVRKNNLKAIRFYELNHFLIIEERNNSYLMECEL